MTNQSFDLGSYELQEPLELPQPVVESRNDRMVRLAMELRRMGVSERVSLDLLTAFPLDLVEQQLAWLPYRRAKRRSSLIVAAIKGDYEKPAVLIEEEFGGPDATA